MGGEERIENSINIKNTERELFNKAYYLIEAIEASWSIRIWIVSEANKEGVAKQLCILAKYDKKFREELNKLLRKTEDRLRKEFDEL